jgi:hypothetical protein
VLEEQRLDTGLHDSAAQIEAESLRDTERKRPPRYPIPCVRIGRLAVDRCLKAR